MKQEMIKHEVIKQYLNHRVFIETGTYLGGTVDALKDLVGEIHSIELNDNLFKQAVEKFKGHSHIFLHHGDSSDLLEGIIPDEPCLFWLDGHYSAGITSKGKLYTPIRKELDIVLNHRPDHTILIDDAQYFTGDNDYPTVNEIMVLAKDRKFEMKEGIMIIT